MSMQEKYDSFEKEFVSQWAEYIKHQDELKSYRGRPIDNDVERVNEILFNIQKSFSSVYPCLNFILKRYDFAKEAVRDYDRFIEDIKKAGAIAEGDIRA